LPTHTGEVTSTANLLPLLGEGIPRLLPSTPHIMKGGHEGVLLEAEDENAGLRPSSAADLAVRSALKARRLLLLLLLLLLPMAGPISCPSPEIISSSQRPRRGAPTV